MAAAEKILKNFNLYVDGRGYAGNVSELTLPPLNLKLDEHRTGGMDAPISVDMGMEKLECSFSLSEHGSDVLRLFGVNSNGRGIALTARGSVESITGEKVPVVVNMEGTVTSIEDDAWQAGEKVMQKFTVQLVGYKYLYNGDLIHHIDIPNMIRIVNGVDQLAQTRANIGL